VGPKWTGPSRTGSVRPGKGLIISKVSVSYYSGGCVVGAHGEMELRVVSILVILYAVVKDDVGDWAAVDERWTWVGSIHGLGWVGWHF